MQATSHAQDEAIFVSDKKIPMPIRLFGIGVGVAVSIRLLIELYSVLWPPMLLTLFVAPIVIIGLAIVLIFLAVFAFMPDQKWEIQRGKLNVTYQLFNQIAVKTYRPNDLDECAVRERYDDDRPNTYYIVCPLRNGRKMQMGLPSTPFHLAFGIFLLETNLALRGSTSKQEKTLFSPSFTKREYAENALAHFMGRCSGG